MHQSHSVIAECGRAGVGVPSHLESSTFRVYFSWQLWSAASPWIDVQFTAFWYTVFVGRQVCPLRSVGLNCLQVYTASQVEQDFKKVKIQTQQNFLKLFIK